MVQCRQQRLPLALLLSLHKSTALLLSPILTNSVHLHHCLPTSGRNKMGVTTQYSCICLHDKHLYVYESRTWKGFTLLLTLNYLPLLLLLLLLLLLPVDSTLLLTASADNSARLWDCATGKTVRVIDTSTSVRTCSFSALGDRLMISTDERKVSGCEVMVYDVRAADSAIATMPSHGSKVTAALWGPFDHSIIAGHEDGSLCHYDYQVIDGGRERGLGGRGEKKESTESKFITSTCM